jgi:hypothetical protein
LAALVLRARNDRINEDLPAIAVEAAILTMQMVQRKEADPQSVRPSALSNQRKLTRALLEMADKALREGQKWVLVEAGLNPESARTASLALIAAHPVFGIAEPVA